MQATGDPSPGKVCAGTSRLSPYLTVGAKFRVEQANLADLLHELPWYVPP